MRLRDCKSCKTLVLSKDSGEVIRPIGRMLRTQAGCEAVIHAMLYERPETECVLLTGVTNAKL